VPEQATAPPDNMAESKRAAEPLEPALRRLALMGIDDALAEVDGAQDDEAAVHALRKECKRMRALLHLFASALSGRGRRERRRFRDLGRSLSARRDARVVLDVHEALLARYGALLDPTVGAEVRQRMIAAMQSTRVNANGSGAEPMDRDRIRSVLLEARAAAQDLSLTTKRRSVLLDAVEGTYRQGRAAGERCLETPDPNHLHAWRKRVKALSYQLELLAALWPGAELPSLKPVKQLSDLLGQAQDLAIYRDAIERFASDRNPLGVELLAAIAERQRRGFRRQALKLGQQIYQDKPKRFRSRLKAATRIR
jgi:CHAD domain-containing protein